MIKQYWIHRDWVACCCGQALRPHISDGTSRFWVNFRFVRQWFWFTQHLSFGVLGEYKEYKGITTLYQAPFYLIFFFVFYNLTTPQLCVPHLFSAKQINLKDAKSISLHKTKLMCVLVPDILLNGDILWLCWFFSWRNLDSFTTMLPCILNEIAFAIISPPFDLL